MKKIIKIILPFIMMFSFVACTKTNKISAHDMLFDFYKQYLSNSIDNEQFKNELLQKYCTKNMLKTLDILYSFDEQEGVIVGIDYDPFINAQDIFPIESLKISKNIDNTYQISFDNTDISIKVNVVKEDSNWKIDSLDSYNLEQVKEMVNDYWKNK